MRIGIVRLWSAAALLASGTLSPVFATPPPNQYQYRAPTAYVPPSNNGQDRGGGPTTVDPQPALYLVALGDPKAPGPLEEQVLALKKDGCLFTDMVLDKTGTHDTDYRCYVVSGAPVTQTGYMPFSVAFNFPSGMATNSFNHSSSGGAMPGPQDPAAPVKFLKYFIFQNAAPPSLAATGTTPPLVHLTVADLDCRFQVEGQPETRCLVTNWAPNRAMVYVDGDYLKQPAPLVTIQVLQQGTDWHIVPDHFAAFTPVMLAVKQQDTAALQALIAQHVDLNAHDPGTDAPLAIAVADKRLDIATLLVDHGADANTTSKDGFAVLSGALAGAYMTQMQDHNQNQNRNQNQPPAPSRADWVNFIKLLIAHHADVNRVDSSGTTPLTVAVGSAQLDVVQLLVAAGADVNKPALSFGIMGVAGWSPMSPYDSAAKWIDVYRQLQGESGMTSSADPTQSLHAIMDYLGKHGAKFLPNGGALAAGGMHFEPAQAGGLTLVGPAGAGASGEMVTVTDVSTRKAAAAKVQSDGSFRIPVAGDPKDLYSVALSGDGISGPPVYLHGDDPALSLTLDSPAPGAVAGDRITVAGSFNGPADTGIQIQDGFRDVQRFRGRFVASDLPLKPGANTIKVTAITTGGLTVSKTVTVSSAAQTLPLRLMPSRAYGPKADPLELDVRVWMPDTRVVKSLRLSWLGNTVDDVALTDPTQIRAALSDQQPEGSPFKHHYPAPGIYTLRMTMVDAAGASATLTEPVVLPDRGEDNQAIQAVWKNFTTALAAGDADAALTYFSDAGRQQYKNTLGTLASKGRDIVASMSPLMGSPTGEGDGADYLVVRKGVPNGGGNSFFIHFIRYPDGRWLLDSM